VLCIHGLYKWCVLNENISLLKLTKLEIEILKRRLERLVLLTQLVSGIDNIN